MLKKSLSDLSTTILSAKDSVVGKNNELDSDQIKISALITSYSMKKIIINYSKKITLFSKSNYIHHIKLGLFIKDIVNL